MKYKVGDRVKIKSREWYELNRNKDGEYEVDGLSFTDGMTKFCGKEATITYSDEDDGTYQLDIDSSYWFNDGMLENSTLDNAETPHISEQLIKDIAEVIKSHNLGVSVSENEGKLIIEPLEEKKEDDLPIGTPCMVTDDMDKPLNFLLRYYAGNKKVFPGGKSYGEIDDAIIYRTIIPCNKFNFDNPEESLKYNIVK